MSAQTAVLASLRSDGASAMELAWRTGFSRGYVVRTMKILLSKNLVVFDDGKYFRLST